MINELLLHVETEIGLSAVELSGFDENFPLDPHLDTKLPETTLTPSEEN